MKKLSVIVLLALVLLIVPIISAANAPQQSTQQYNKIYLDPFYRESLPTRNIPYFYNVTINPPDGISEVKSAIITFSIWHNPTIEYDLTVNGQHCNNPTFLVHTSFENAGNNKISFDCSNVITTAGFYNISITPDDDTGAVTAWVEITYMNDPKGSFEIHGTEYTAGNPGRVFLQLLDADSEPVNYSSCYASIYYPDDSTFKFQQLMGYVDEGLYRYDFTTPYIKGVYMVSAFCTLPALNIDNKTIQDNFESGGGSGGSGWDTSWTLDSCAVDTTSAHTGSYSMRCYNDRNPERSFSGNSSFVSVSYSFWWRATSLEAAEYVYYEMEDANNDDHILLTITDGDDDGVWHQQSGTLYVDIDSFDIDGVLKFKISTSNNLENGDYYYLDDINISVDAPLPLNTTEYQIVRGSSEVHVNSDENYVIELYTGELTNKSLKEDFVFHYNVISQTENNKTGQEIDIQLWRPFPCDHIINVSLNEGGNYTLMNYTGTTDDEGRCIVEVQDAVLDMQQTYDYEIRTENQWKVRLYEDYSNVLLEEEMINISCQNYVLANNLTNFTLPITNFTSETDKLWLSCASYLDNVYHYKEVVAPFFGIINVTMNFTYEEMEELESDWAHMQDIIEKSNSYSSGIFDGLNLENSYSLELLSDPYPPTNPGYAKYFANISTSYLNYLAILANPASVWSYENRTVTGGNVSVDTSSVAADVWGYNNRSLTNYTQNNTAIANAVWSYSGTIGTNLINQITQGVWEYTGVPVTSLLNNISSNTWNFATRELTQYNDTTNYTKINEEIPDLVWTYENRTVTGGNISAGNVSVSGNVTIDPADIWNYSGDINSNITGQIVNDTWNATARYTHGVINT